MEGGTVPIEQAVLCLIQYQLFVFFFCFCLSHRTVLVFYDVFLEINVQRRTEKNPGWRIKENKFSQLPLLPENIAFFNENCLRDFVLRRKRKRKGCAA